MMRASNDRGPVLQREYSLRFGKHAEYRKAVWRTLCRALLSRHIPPESTVLDLGAGWGELINNVQASKRYAMDLNPETASHLDPEVTFLQQDCALPWPIPEASLDVVFTSNFLEHLASKEHVERTLAQAYRCLRVGGRLVCLGPNIRFLPGSYWDFWDHNVPLSDRSLKELLALVGFEVESCIPRLLPYSMSQGWNPPLLALRLYLKLPLLWRFIGRQFLIIARRT